MTKAEEYGWQPFDPLPNGTKRWIRFDEKGEVQVRYETTAPQLGAMLDNNSTARNHTTGFNQERTMKRVASIPYAVGLKWLAEEGWWFEDPQHSDRLLKKLQDSDWQDLRTSGGRLAMGQNGEIR